MTYQEETQQLSAKAEAAVVAAYLALEDEEFPEVGAQLTSAFNLAAITLADLSLATLLRVLPVGLGAPDGDLDRLVKSYTTSVAESEAAKDRVAQVARSEPLRSGQRAYTQVMSIRADRLLGWTRKTSPGSCELCNSLADGSVLPVGAQMIAHVNCTCVQVPLIKEVAA